MNEYLVVFPGQGSQVVGMGKDVYETPEGRYVFDLVDRIMDFPLSNLILQGPMDQLSKTEYLQPAIYAVSMALWHYFIKHYNNPFQYALGHSLGEYTSVVAASMISMEEGAWLLKLRGKAMHESSKNIEGLVAVILGMNAQKVEEVLEKYGYTTDQVSIANDNSEKQVVLSGIKDFVQQACHHLKESGAKRVEILPITVPVHSIHMESAMKEMKRHLEALSWNKPTMSIFMNASGQCLTDVDLIVENLWKQIANKIKFKDCILDATKHNIHKSVEFGPKNVLSNLIKRITTIIQPLSVQNLDSLKEFTENQ